MTLPYIGKSQPMRAGFAYLRLILPFRALM